MSEDTVKILVEMPAAMKADLDRIVDDLMIPRNAVIRFACREYIARFFAAQRSTDKPADPTDEPVAA